MAGYTTAGCVTVTGLAFLVASTDDALCTHRCPTSPSFAALIWMLAAAFTAGGIAMLWSVRARPVEPDGETGWMWGLCVLFVLGAALIVGGFPTHVCPPGVRLDTNFHLCIDVAAGHRFPATDRARLKDLAIAVALVVGLTAMRWRRGVVVTAPVAAAAWLVGAGWLLRDTVGR